MKLDQHFSKRYTFFLCTRNRRDLLAANLERFRQLKKAEDELIVIDGGSTDGTVDLIKENLGHIDRWVSEPDRSEGEALNKAVLLAQGRYLKVLTDDDIFHEEAIEKAYAVMEANPQIDLLLCGGTVQRANTDRVQTRMVKPGANYGKGIDDAFDLFSNGLGWVLRHSSIPRTGIFSPKAFSLDLDFVTQCLDNGACIRFCRLNVVHHIIYDHSCSVRQTERMKKDYARIGRRYGRRDIAWANDPQNVLERALGLYVRYRKEFWRRLWKRVAGRPTSDETPPAWDGGFS